MNEAMRTPKRNSEKSSGNWSSINLQCGAQLEEAGWRKPSPLHRLGVGTLLRQSLASSNPIESCFSICRKKWPGM